MLSNSKISFSSRKNTRKSVEKMTIMLKGTKNKRLDDAILGFGFHSLATHARAPDC